MAPPAVLARICTSAGPVRGRRPVLGRCAVRSGCPSTGRSRGTTTPPHRPCGRSHADVERDPARARDSLRQLRRARRGGRFRVQPGTSPRTSPAAVLDAPGTRADRAGRRMVALRVRDTPGVHPHRTLCPLSGREPVAVHAAIASREARAPRCRQIRLPAGRARLCAIVQAVSVKRTHPAFCTKRTIYQRPRTYRPAPRTQQASERRLAPAGTAFTRRAHLSASQEQSWPGPMARSLIRRSGFRLQPSGSGGVAEAMFWLRRLTIRGFPAGTASCETDLFTVNWVVVTVAGWPAIQTTAGDGQRITGPNRSPRPVIRQTLCRGCPQTPGRTRTVRMTADDEAAPACGSWQRSPWWQPP